MYTRKISKCTRFRNLHLRVDGDRALGPVSFFSSFFPSSFSWRLLIDADRPLKGVRFFLLNMLRKYPGKSCSCCEFECWWDRPLDKVDLLEKWLRFKRYKYVRLRVPADRPLKLVRFSFFKFFWKKNHQKKNLTITISGSFRWRGAPMESKLNCQRQFGPHYQDLGLAIWSLPVDADRALAFVSFFLTGHSSW